MSDTNSKRTPLYSCHVEHKARIVDFAGWEMPIQYQGIVAEHKAVREHVGVFDVSHMGRVEVKGSKALATIQPWITNDAAALQDGQSLYTPICYPNGGIVDDCLVYRLKEDHFIIVINASNRQKDYEWFCEHIPAENKADVELTTPEAGDKWGLLAVQGPKTRTLLGELTDTDVQSIPRNTVLNATVAGIDNCMLACTGYTGEDGFEIFVPTEKAAELWGALMDKGEAHSISPVGLGARDTLRMEMRYPLYGSDIDKDTTPIEAGLAWTVKLDKGDFIGREVIEAQVKSKPPRRLVGFKMLERGIPRHGYKILSQDGEQELGVVTSGGFSPSLQEAIGIGYVPAKPHFAKVGSKLLIEVRKKHIPVQVVRTPFYQPKKES